MQHAGRVMTGATTLPGDTLPVLAAIGAFLAVATLVRRAAYRLDPSPVRRERWYSLGTWWGLAALLAVMLVMGRAGAVLVMAGLSLLALREGLALAGRRRCFPMMAALAGAVYLWALLDWRSLFLRAIPVFAVLLGLAELGRRIRGARGPDIGTPGPGRPDDTETARSGRPRDVVLAFLMAVLGPSFVVAVASLPGWDAPGGGPVVVVKALTGADMGWLLLLLGLTELNDAVQAWWGRAFGARPMAPDISPRKTWAGFAGGVLTTVVLAVVLTPLLTGYGAAGLTARPAAAPAALAAYAWLWSALLGLLLALAGIAGDLVASALKRRADARHSGDLLPGHGGVLDRLDSLSLTAPVFFVIVYVVLFVVAGPGP